MVFQETKVVERHFPGAPDEHFPGNSQHAPRRQTDIASFLTLYLSWWSGHGALGKMDFQPREALFFLQSFSPKREGHPVPRKQGQCGRGADLQPPSCLASGAEQCGGKRRHGAPSQSNSGGPCVHVCVCVHVHVYEATGKRRVQGLFQLDAFGCK